MKMTATPPWSASKSRLLQGIANANAANRVYKIQDFNARDVSYFAAEGWVTLGILGPVITASGERKLARERR